MASPAANRLAAAVPSPAINVPKTGTLSKGVSKIEAVHFQKAPMAVGQIPDARRGDSD